jgi:hypothetical protein
MTQPDRSQNPRTFQTEAPNSLLVLVEGKEDLTVRPARASIKRRASLPTDDQPVTPEDFSGIPAIGEQK